MCSSYGAFLRSIGEQDLSYAENVCTAYLIVYGKYLHEDVNAPYFEKVKKEIGLALPMALKFSEYTKCPDLETRNQLPIAGILNSCASEYEKFRRKEQVVDLALQALTSKYAILLVFIP